MLPKEFKPGELYDLVRLGKNNDGGYLVCKNSVEISDFLISFYCNSLIFGWQTISLCAP